MINFDIPLPKIDTGPFDFSTASTKKIQSFTEFVNTVTNDKYKWYDYCQRLADVLERVIVGDLTRLMIFMPPRHGKSELVSRLFSAYYLYKNPDKWVGLNSYGAELSNTFSRSARDNYKYAGGQLKDDAYAMKHWETGKGGGLWAAGVGGPITGKGFDCLPANSRITTSYGTIRIETLVQLKNKPEVLSYNEKTKKLEWKRIVATATKPGKPLVEIALHSGGRIRCTTDHFIYSFKRGYVQASDIVPGETLVQVAPIQELSCMRSEYGAQCTLQEMLSDDSVCKDKNKVRSLPKGNFSRAVSGKEVVGYGFCRPLLFCRMQQVSSCNQKSTSVFGLQSAYRNQDEPILQEVPAIAAGFTKDKAVRLLRQRVPPKKLQDDLLLEGMCELCTLYTNEGTWQQPLQGRDQLRELVSEDETYRFGARQQSVCCMQQSQQENQDSEIIKGRYVPEEITACNSSYRPQSVKQSSKKLNSPMLDLPQEASRFNRQWQLVTVSRIRKVGDKPNKVYDIQVEGNRNFFADSILVHNCGIIDDPVKNSEEANSPAIIRRNQDWFDSTFSTREEPNSAIVCIGTRWGKRELFGYILEKELEEPDHWHIVHCEAIKQSAKPKYHSTITLEPDNRKPGEALSPERYPLEELSRKKRRSGLYVWNALYQQSPTLKKGRVYHAFNDSCIGPHSSQLTDIDGYYHAHDFGAVNRAFGLFAKIDDKFYLCHEAILDEGTTAQRAGTIKSHFSNRKVVRGWGGAPSEKQQRADYAQFGVIIGEPPITEVDSQVDMVNRMFEDGTLKICKDMLLTISQLENCIRDDKEQIADKSIWHHLDVLRYFAAGETTTGDLLLW